ncbi:MAG: LytTR family DNA-binding domain-containing protein [Emticicia sp.]
MVAKLLGSLWLSKLKLIYGKNAHLEIQNDKENFIRISRSSIINSLLIKELQKYFSGKYLVIMRDTKTSKIETGSAYGENLKKLMEI